MPIKLQTGDKSPEKKQRRMSPLLLGMAVYALLFLIIAFIGLCWFWRFMAAYELSRPIHAIDDYMERLTPEYIFDSSSDLMEQIDTRIQDTAECREIIRDALQDEVSYAKNISASTETKQVFSLRRGSQVIGSFQIEQTGETSHGFTPWAVTGENFDLSYLITEPVSAAVPENYQVLVNGSLLPAECITQSDIPYEELAEFSENYSLPGMVLYEAGPFLGETALTIIDQEGKLVQGEIDTARILDNCSEEEQAALEQVTKNFLKAYVSFSANSEGSPKTSLQKLSKYIVADSELAERLNASLNSIGWIRAHSANVTAWEFGLRTRLADDLYLCEVTYTVQDLGLVRENHLKIILRQTDSGLLVEDMATC